MSEPSPELQARLAKVDPTSVAAVARQYRDPNEITANGKTRDANRIAGSRRQKTGKKFEADIDDTHEGFARDGFGYMMPHYPPTNIIPKPGGPPKLIYRKGGGPCDYSGHVNARWTTPADFTLVSSADVDAGRGVRVPVVFDAKVLNAEKISYTHDPEHIAQLYHLQNAAKNGALAFLLVRADMMGRCFAIRFDKHADTLLARRPIRLFERENRECFPLLPSVGYVLGKGWLWPKMIPALSQP
jgi:hypothetical protein